MYVFHCAPGLSQQVFNQLDLTQPEGEIWKQVGTLSRKLEIWASSCEWRVNCWETAKEKCFPKGIEHQKEIKRWRHIGTPHLVTDEVALY